MESCGKPLLSLKLLHDLFNLVVDGVDIPLQPLDVLLGLPDLSVDPRDGVVGLLQITHELPQAATRELQIAHSFLEALSQLLDGLGEHRDRLLARDQPGEVDGPAVVASDDPTLHLVDIARERHRPVSLSYDLQSCGPVIDKESVTPDEVDDRRIDWVVSDQAGYRTEYSFALNLGEQF